jgi:hypothetical protein
MIDFLLFYVPLKNFSLNVYGDVTIADEVLHGLHSDDITMITIALMHVFVETEVINIVTPTKLHGQKIIIYTCIFWCFVTSK